ncbi:hypothetical protein ROZALSC1DRAFT_24512, partial [Rozella allomycis CSF55]
MIDTTLSLSKFPKDLFLEFMRCGEELEIRALLEPFDDTQDSLFLAFMNKEKIQREIFRECLESMFEREMEMATFCLFVEQLSNVQRVYQVECLFECLEDKDSGRRSERGKSGMMVEKSKIVLEHFHELVDETSFVNHFQDFQRLISNPELFLHVLKVVSKYLLPEELNDKLIKELLKQIATVNPIMLPELIESVCEMATKSNCKVIIEELRESIDVEILKKVPNFLQLEERLFERLNEGWIRIASLILQLGKELNENEVYEKLFESGNLQQCQEIVHSIITLISLNNFNIQEKALNVLINLSKKGLLEYVDSIQSESVLYKLFFLLFYLAQNDESLENQLQIFVRKNLSSPKLEYKKIGLISSMAFIQVNQETKAIDLLDLVNSSCRYSSVHSAMLYDCLAHSVEQDEFPLNDETISIINKLFCGYFGDFFIMDHQDIQSYLQDEKSDLLYSLNDENEINENSMAISIIPNIVSSLDSRSIDPSFRIVTLAPFFRLVAACQLKINKSFKKIEKLLSARLALYKDMNDNSDEI